MAYETTSESTEALLVTGGVGTGKTQRLVERAAALLAENAAAGNVLVLCATPQAARLFSERLTARVDVYKRQGRRLTAQDRKKERWTTSRRKPTPA